MCCRMDTKKRRKPNGSRRFGRVINRPAASGCLLAIRFQPLIDQRHLGIDRGQAKALLPGDKLNELVGPLNKGGTIVERASG